VSAAADVPDPYQTYQAALLDAGLLIRTAVRGVYGLAGAFEEVLERFDAYATRMGADRHPEVIRFPPLLPRRNYQQTDHLETFPNLMGSVHTFLGDERASLRLAGKKAAGEDWTADLSPTEVMMTPAACYPLYPTATGTLPTDGRIVDLRSFVFRHEPSDDPARLQIFRMREFVRLGTPDQALEHRQYWLGRAEEMLRAAGLDVKPVLANDPFFGRGGRVMAATQREQELKYEMVVPVASEESPTAVASCNYHLDHFGHSFDIRTADGAVAHSACVGFGLERVTLALFKKHGFSPAQWPSDVRRILEL
jgi:seryl-tRNA synthetase